MTPCFIESLEPNPPSLAGSETLELLPTTEYTMLVDNTKQVGDVWPWEFVPNCDYNLSFKDVIVDPPLSSDQSTFYTMIPE